MNLKASSTRDGNNNFCFEILSHFAGGGGGEEGPENQSTNHIGICCWCCMLFALRALYFSSSVIQEDIYHECIPLPLSFASESCEVLFHSLSHSVTGAVLRQAVCLSHWMDDCSVLLTNMRRRRKRRRIEGTSECDNLFVLFLIGWWLQFQFFSSWSPYSQC